MAGLHETRLCGVIQVLYLIEPIDEPAINNVGDFNEFKFVDVTREGLDLGDIPEEDKKKVRTFSIIGFGALCINACADLAERSPVTAVPVEATCCQM